MGDSVPDDLVCGESYILIHLAIRFCNSSDKGYKRPQPRWSFCIKSGYRW